MRNLIFTMSAVRRILAVAAVVCGFGLVAAAQDSTHQQIYLPDPTPRPPDLQRRYGDDPLARAELQQALLLKKAQLRLQVHTDVDKLVVLAQQLQTETAAHEKDGTGRLNSAKAGEIEKLAKSVKEKMKSQ